MIPRPSSDSSTLKFRDSQTTNSSWNLSRKVLTLEIRSLSLLRRLRLFHSTHRILPPPPECLGPDSSVIVPYTGQNTSGNPPTGYHQQDANFCPCPAPILQNPGDLTIHLRNVHFIRNEVRKQNNTELQHSSTGACPFPFCAAPIRRPKDAVKHLRSAHFNGNGVQISSYNSLEYLDTGRFICEVPGCGASILIRNRSFVNHYKEHFIRYFCPENGCKYHASRRNLLVRHARLKHDGRVDVKNVLPAFVTGFH